MTSDSDSNREEQVELGSVLVEYSKNFVDIWIPVGYDSEGQMVDLKYLFIIKNKLILSDTHFVDGHPNSFKVITSGNHRRNILLFE